MLPSLAQQIIFWICMRRWVLFVLVLATLRARQAYKAHKHAHKSTHTHDACTRTNDKVAQSHSLSPVWNVANTFTWSILKRKLRIIFLWLPINSCTRINPQKIHCPSVCAKVMHWAALSSCYSRDTGLLLLSNSLTLSHLLALVWNFVRYLCSALYKCVCVCMCVVGG